MACASCGFENREATRFCVECGAPLARACPRCDAPVEVDQRFCGECGAALTGSVDPASAERPPDAVRKTVTVLFADLGGSTGFGERTDAEISRRVLADYHALLQATIDAHAGTVAKFMGDGMMATFGIPEVAEDDARRAVDAGAALQAGFEAFAADVERQHGETLTLRVGINTGEVVIGDADADLIGDALNVAARLEKACRPGHVLVGEETWRLTRGEVAYEALGEVSVAGRTQPVAIYELTVDGSAPDAEVVAPFVGRDAEMERLVAAFDDARVASAARLVTVLGSPGVGKTRLSRELARQVAKEADAVTFETRCVRSGEATFAPVAQLIRDALDLGDDADADAARAAIVALLPAAEGDDDRVADVLAGLVGAAPTRSVEETFWAIRRLVEAVATQRPMVIVIDDVQWAEPLLLDLLEHLAEWVSGAPVLLVALARPELREVRPALAEPGRPVAAVLVLDGLDAQATEALAAGLLGADRLPAGLVERLPSSTDGNPLFVRELVRMLVDDHVIRARGDGEWELTIDAEAVDVPPTIQSLLGARVERLPAPERQLLELASVIGPEFSLGALRELAGDQTPIAPLLDAMRRKELVEPTGTYWGDEPVHRFHHVLIREAAYRRLLKTTRAELHERVAEWTDRAAAGVLGEHETAIAHHYERAHLYRAELGTLDEHTATLGRRAAALLTTAAHRALGGDDLASAAGLSTRALALLPDADREARADLLLLACECLLASGNAAAAREVVEELGTVAGDDLRLAAWADCFSAQLVSLTDPEGLVAADTQVRSAAAAFGDLGDGSGQAKAHQVRAGILARLGRVGDAEAELDLALAAARLADDRRRVTAVLGAAPDAALFGPSPVARAGGRCLDVVRLLRITSASPSVEAASNRCQAVLEALRGRFDVARSMLATARAAVEELGLRHGLAQTDLFAGMVELIAGDPHAAIPSLRVAFRDLGALGAGADAGIAAALLARAALVDGAVDEADEMASASEALAGQNLKTAVGWRVARAEVMAAQGDLADAVALAEEAVQIAAGTDLIVDHGDACAALAQLRAHAGDHRGSEAARADAAHLYEQKGATVLLARLGERPEPSTPATAPPATGSPGPPAIENGATRALEPWWALQREERFEEMRTRVRAGDFFADGYVRVDHRSTVSAEDTDALGIIDAMEELMALGLREVTVEPVAVRGERLALLRHQFRSPDGTELTFLILVETDGASRFLHSANYDDDQLAEAILELDARYLAGAGAEHHELAATLFAWVRALNAFEFDTMRGLASPKFVLLDWRQIALPILDIDGFIALQQEYAAALLETRWIITNLRIRGRVALTDITSRGVDANGGDVEWRFHLVGCIDTEGRTARSEVFGEEQWEAAVARFEELSAVDPRTPRAENLASCTWAKVFALSQAGDPAKLAGLFAEDYRFVDLRPIVGLGEHDRDSAARVLAATVDEFEVAVDLSALAVRGERLALSRGGWFTEGTESSCLSLAEVDGGGTMVACTLYGEDQLAQAIAELDARYLVGEGAEHPQAAATISTWAAAGAGEWDGYLEWCAPDFRLIDHRSLAWPELDREGFVDLLRVTADAVPDMVQVLRKVFVGPGVNLTISDASGTADGGHFEWVAYGVNQVDEHGRLHRLELFDERDWNAALALFDELSGAAARASGADGGPQIENAATRLNDRFFALTDQGRMDEAYALIAEGYERIDRRQTVAAPLMQGPEGYQTVLEASREVGFDSFRVTPLAVRGDRLALSRAVVATVNGFEMTFLVVDEVGIDGRSICTVYFDEDDVSSAQRELDERYLAGEGAAHAEVIRAALRVDHAFSKDPESLNALSSADFALEDHRRLLYGPGDLGYLVSIRHASPDDHVDRTVTVNRTVLVEGRALLTAQDLHRVDPDGSEYRWRYTILVAFDDEMLLRRLEWFDENDWHAALARLHEVAADRIDDERSAGIENTATRLMDRFPVLARERRFDEMADLVAERYVRVDHRGGLPAPTAHGPSDFVDLIKATVEVGFDEIRNTPLAVRGERLALSRVDVRSADGRELVFLQIHEWDGEQLAYASHYDEGDLDEAVAELDARFISSEGAEQELSGRSNPRTPAIENTSTRALRDLWAAAIDRRWDDVGTRLAPQIDRIDHRSGVSSPPTHGAAAYLEVLHAAFDRGEVERVDLVPLAVRGQRLSLNRLVSHAQGFEIAMLMVVELDDRGQIARLAVHDDDDLPVAIMALDSRHAELRGPDCTAGERSLAACFVAWHHHDWNALESVFEPDFTRDDRTKLGMGVHDLASYLQSLREFSALVPGVTPYAAKVYAEPGALLVVWPTQPYEVDGSAFAWDVIYVIRESPSGRAAHLVSFDSADWAHALALFMEWTAGAEAPTPALENAATRALERMAEMMRDGDLDGLATLYPEDAVCDDRRTGVSSGVSVGRAATLDLIHSLLDVGLREVAHEVLAVRGDDLALAARRTARDDGFELALLTVVEVDGAGRMSRALLFDRSDLVGALEALEQRRLERHGTTMLRSERWHLDDLLRTNRGEDDPARLAPGYRLVDHSYAGFGDTDADGQQAQLDVMRSQVSSLAIVPSRIHASERAVLAPYLIVGIDQDGADYRWEMANVQHYDENGLITAAHSFQIEQWAEAVALFDELSSTAAPMGPPALENAVDRSLERMREVFAAKDWEAVADQYPEDTECDDRRSGVSSGITTGREALVALVRGLADVGFVSFDSETLAIRGDRLALMLRRWQRQDGFELPVLAVQEVDNEGRQAWIALFDADDIVSAIDALEDRYARLRGASYSELERRYVDGVHRFNHGDLRAPLADLAPDYLTIDHSPLGFGTSDAAAMGEQVELMASSVEEIVELSTQRLVAPRAILDVMRMLGTTAERGDILWDYVTIRCHHADGLVARDHTFQVEQWDEALALFDEWPNGPDQDEGGPLQNAATRHSMRFREVLAAEGITAVRALLRPDLSYEDHRMGGIAPAGTKADDFLAHVRSARSAGFTTVEFTTLAIRGDRLSLDRWKTVTDAGDVVEHVSVKEVDEAGLCSRTELFDLVDLPRAVAVLDEWYLEGEGAEHAWAIGPKAAFTRCLNARDWDGVRGLLPPQVETVDHRLASTGTTLETPDLAIAHMRELIELVPDFTSFDAELVAIGRQCTLARQIAFGRSTEGAEVEFATLLLSQLVDGKFARTEIFPPEQLAEARARFEELEAEAAGPVVSD